MIEVLAVLLLESRNFAFTRLTFTTDQRIFTRAFLAVTSVSLCTVGAVSVPSCQAVDAVTQRRSLSSSVRRATLPAVTFDGTKWDRRLHYM